tara:strand:- start:509 stop:670 length:162 start_codon:yes stop_codon:yes gene_type:complete
MKSYQIKTIGGAVYVRQAESLLQLFKDIHLIYMNELGYYIDEFISIKEVQDDE